MSKVMSATEARIHFGELLRHVTEQREPVVVERAGKPYAVVLSIDAYERLIAGKQPVDHQKILTNIVQLGTKIRARLKDAPMLPPEEIIRQMREERDDQLGNHLS